MTVLSGGYVGGPTTCSGKPRAGCKNLMSVFLERYAHVGAKNLGIYNCRPVRGGTTMSIHADGRAGDHGCPVGSQGWMQPWCDLLVANSQELGVQCVIYNKRIWSSSRSKEGWRKYTGVSPHTDHAHVEQTPHSAANLTADRARQVLGMSIPAVAPTPAPAPPKFSPQRLVALGFPASEAGIRAFQFAAGIGVDGDFGPVSNAAANKVPAYPGANARSFQHRLQQRGWKITVDGDWGPKSQTVLKAFQKEKGLTVDGKMGPQSWTALWTRGT